MQVIDQSDNFSTTKFDDAFVNYFKERPHIRNYIGPLYMRTGNGWTYDLIRVFGLTIRGIERVLVNLGLDVPVLVSELQFKDFVQANPSGLAKAIISNELYETSDSGKHVYTLAYQKLKEHHILYVYDVAGAELPKEVLEKCFNGEPFIVYYPTKTRQQPWDTHCYAYAIHDLGVIDSCPPPVPEIAQSSFALSVLSGFGLFKSFGPSLSEIRRFDLDPQFFTVDIYQYKKQLFKMVIDLELDKMAPSMKLA